MSFVTEPRVELIGKPIIEIDGIMRFLDEHGYDWPEFTDKLESMMSLGDDDGEWLVEFAGRMCYQSWAKKGETIKSRSHDDHVKHLIEVAHGAAIEHATYNFAIWNVSRTLSHELVRHRIASYCLAGDTIINGGIKSKGRWSSRGEKRTIKQIYEWTLDGFKRGNVKKIKVRCFDGEKFVQANIKSVQKSGLKDTFRITLEDGKQICCSKDHRFLVKNNIGNEWKPLKNIKNGDLIAINGIMSHKSKEWLYNQYQIKNLLPREIAVICGVSRQTIMNWIKKFDIQKLSRPPITELTRKKLSDCKSKENSPQWKGNLVKPDGGRARAKRWYEDRPCEQCGSVNNICRHHIDRNTVNNHISNIVFLCNACHKRLHNNEDGYPNRLIVKWVKVKDIEYCKKQMTYDLEIDHPASNFVANNIVTHNSQLSQRYVDSSNVAFVVPPAIQELAKIDEEAYKMWVEHCERSRQVYEKLTSKLSDMYENIENKLERRKKARQASRSVLPGCTETKIFVSMNARALRHLIELRANEAADVEIRALAVKVCRILQNKAPLFAHGLGIIDLPDGTKAVKSDHRRV